MLKIIYNLVYVIVGDAFEIFLEVCTNLVNTKVRRIKASQFQTGHTNLVGQK